MKFFSTVLLLIIGSLPILSFDEIRQVNREYNEHLDAQMEVSPIERIKPMGVEPIQAITNVSEEEVCLAQVLYSETKNDEHRIKIGWTTRNRVRDGFRGNTYCEVAFAPGQFSALSYKGDPQHRNVISIHERYRRGRTTTLETIEWESALRAASAIIDAPEIINPVPDAIYFLHYETFVEGHLRLPNWAKGKVADYTIRKPGTKDVLWAFYSTDTIG